MKKKELLSNSFSSRTRKPKPSLSDDMIEQIVESREKEKKQKVTPEIISTKPAKITTPPISKTSIDDTKPAIKVAPPSPPKVEVSKKTKPKKSSNEEVSRHRTRRKSEEKQALEREIKTSFDIPESLYDDMRIHLIRRKKSMRAYLLDLIKKDLGK